MTTRATWQTEYSNISFEREFEAIQILFLIIPRHSPFNCVSCVEFVVGENKR